MVVGKRVLIVSSKLIDLLQKEHISWVKMYFFFKENTEYTPHSLPLPKDCHLQVPASWRPLPPPPPHTHTPTIFFKKRKRNKETNENFGAEKS